MSNNRLREEGAFEDLSREVEAKGYMSEADYYAFFRVLGERFKKAWNAFLSRRVKKYVFSPSGEVLWVVVGRERDYLILPTAGFCSCDDFFYRVMAESSSLCYHLVAQRLAKALNLYDTVEECDDFYHVLMKEWKKVTL